MIHTARIEIPAISFFRYRELLKIRELDKAYDAILRYNARKNDHIRLTAAVFDDGITVRPIIRSEETRYGLYLDVIKGNPDMENSVPVKQEMTQTIVFESNGDTYEIVFELDYASISASDDTCYRNPIPSVDDEPQSRNVVIAFTFPESVTKKEAAAHLVKYISENGLTENAIHLVGEVTMRYATPQPYCHSRPYEKTT